MTTPSHIEAESVRTDLQLNYLLLNFWFRQCAGFSGLEIPESALTVDCEVLGTPVSESVTIQPGLRSADEKTSSIWFWIKRLRRDSTTQERFFLVLEEAAMSRTVYVRNFTSSRYGLSVNDYYGRERRAVERTLNERFQAFLMLHLEVALY